MESFWGLMNSISFVVAYVAILKTVISISHGPAPQEESPPCPCILHAPPIPCCAPHVQFILTGWDSRLFFPPDLLPTLGQGRKGYFPHPILTIFRFAEGGLWVTFKLIIRLIV